MTDNFEPHKSAEISTLSRQTIYVEKEVCKHPRTIAIIKKFNNPCIIECSNYREIFNPRRNNFRMQKHHPALILARKHKGHVQQSPYGIGGDNNFYFSHMLNCIYDCSYCFLQSLFSSAHYVVFINYEDFFSKIEKQLQATPKQESHFFSGYDCDSLAYEPITKFASEALDFFASHPNAYLELRTKSLQLAELSKRQPLPNCIVAFSMAPQPVTQEYEKGTPSATKRLQAMGRMAKLGWKIGARLDPLIWHNQWRENYQQMVELMATEVPAESMHSITLGTLRFPKGLAANMQQQHPRAAFLANKMITSDGVLQMEQSAHEEIMEFCHSELLKYYPAEILIPNIA